MRRHLHAGFLDCTGTDMCAWCGQCKACHTVVEPEFTKLPANNGIYGPGCVDCHFWLINITRVDAKLDPLPHRTHAETMKVRQEAAKLPTLAWTGIGTEADHHKKYLEAISKTATEGH